VVFIISSFKKEIFKLVKKGILSFKRVMGLPVSLKAFQVPLYFRNFKKMAALPL